MQNILKTNTLERKFPLLAVENDCIVSKDADVTVGFQVELPEVFTVSSAEYEAIHSAWLKALKVLPDYSIIHKQDIFIRETYKPEIQKEQIGFLSRSFERHFWERPYLHHTCYLFLTRTTKEKMRQQSLFNTLCRGFLVNKEIRDKDTVSRFLEAVAQFAGIINDSGFVRLSRLTGDQIVGSSQKAGILEKYLTLSQEDQTVLQDIQLDPGFMRIGDKTVCLHTLSDLDDLPQKVGTDSRYERLSTDRSDCRMSYAAPVGLLLTCDHIYNQFIFIEDRGETLRQFEKTARNMQSLSKYSRANQINKEWLDTYLNEAHSFGLTPVRCHFNVMAWSDDPSELRKIKNDVGSQLALMECKPRHNTVDVPTLFWSAIPGNAGDSPSEESFYTFAEQALCFFTGETNYRDSSSPFGIKVVDRLTGKPIHLDISDEPMRRGICGNKNKFLVGPSGTGKSFLVNHIARQYYEQGTHVVIVDIGNSYKGLCEMIHNRTNGRDGFYFEYSENDPVSFNPFYCGDKRYDVETRESIKTLLLTLWKRDDEPPSRAEEVALSNAVNLYLIEVQNGQVVPCFNTFYDYLQTDYRKVLDSKNVREKDFDLENLLNVLEPFYKGGEYELLLNSDKQLDLQSGRFMVFELGNIKDNPILFAVTTLVIMSTFINKMRRLQGVRKAFFCDEAWQCVARTGMASFIKFLYKTGRKHFCEIVTITQEINDIVTSPIVRESIVANSDIKILLDMKKYMQRFDTIQELLGLSAKEKDQILSLNQSNDHTRLYKEVWIGLGGVQSNVYGIEVSPQEYAVYTSEESEKLELFRLTDKLGGNMELAVKQLAENRTNKINQS